MTVPLPLSIAWKAVNGLSDRNGLEFSGYIAFTMLLSLFPFLIFLVSIAGFFGQTKTGEEFLSTMSLFEPPEMLATLQPAIQQVIQNRNGSLLTIGLLLALYSAASGISALRLALNMSYGAQENRSYLLRKGEDFLIVIVGSVIAIIASAAIFLGPLIWKIVAWFTFVNAGDARLWHIARYGFTLVSMGIGVIALHRFLPNVRLTIAQILPGALTTTVSWLIAAALLTLYFSKFANYVSTYGSLGGVIITLMFFYVSAIVFIFGGEVNAALLVHARQLTPPLNPELRPSPPHSAS